MAIGVAFVFITAFSKQFRWMRLFGKELRFVTRAPARPIVLLGKNVEPV